jgi:hypothetical protein
MKQYTKLSLAVLASSLLFSGCSSKILMPYKEDFMCPAAKEGGMCGSMTDIYNNSYKDGKLNSITKELAKANNTDDEQTLLIAALWRLNEISDERIDNLEKKISQKDAQNQIVAGMTASLANDIHSIKKRLDALESKEQNATGNEMPIVRSNPIVTKAAKPIKKRAKKPKLNECTANSECVTETNVYAHEKPDRCSRKLRTIPKGTKVTTEVEKNGWLQLNDSGWIGAKYLRKIKETKSDINTTKKQVPFVTDNNKTLAKRDNNGSSKK